MNKHIYYKEYYGELVPYYDELSFGEYYDNPLSHLVNDLIDAGVKEILFDKVDDRYADTLFFKTDKNTDFKQLMLIFCNIRADEFHEVTDNHFRVWFD